MELIQRWYNIILLHVTEWNISTDWIITPMQEYNSLSTPQPPEFSDDDYLFIDMPVAARRKKGKINVKIIVFPGVTKYTLQEYNLQFIVEPTQITLGTLCTSDHDNKTTEEIQCLTPPARRYSIELYDGLTTQRQTMFNAGDGTFILPLNNPVERFICTWDENN
jgi:hypothetical protein